MTDFGRQAVREMEDRGILVDVSHLNDTGYADLFETARRPFVATHSNARAICSHKRNLTDDMIREMVRRNCLIGLNYCKSFITDGGIGDSPDDLYEYFLEKGMSKDLAEGIMFRNAEEFFRKNL